MPSFEGLGAFRLSYLTDSDDGEVKVCSIDGCRSTTRNRKPYCTRHVDNHPHVQELLQRMEDRIAEDQNVNMKGSDVANLHGITSKEILLQLRLNGPRTIERLERELRLTRSIVYKYAVALKKNGVVEFNTTSRGNITVELVDAPDELIDDD